MIMMVIQPTVYKLLLNAFTKAKLEYYTSMAYRRKMGT